MILNPREVPSVDVDDIVPAAAGLDPGYWFYRVATTFTATDTDNPLGESLASDEFIVKVPTFPGKKIQVVLKWTAPVDSLGAALPNVAGYRVYRTASVNGASGQEVLLTTTAAGTLTYTDDATLTPGVAKPLPLGSTGHWATLANLGTARKGAAGAAAIDPAVAGQFYVYGLLGVDATNTVLTSYEYLTVKIGANDHQTVTAGWTLGAKSATAGTGRFQLGAWVADSTTAKTITAPDTFVFIGGGTAADGTTGVKAVQAGKVLTGGDLGTIVDTSGFNTTAAGYGVCAANGQLFTFGGQQAVPSAGAKSAQIGKTSNPVAPPPALENGAWNSEGLTMTHSRFLLGSSVQSSFIFLLGGQTETDAASRTSELVIW